jgi:hypothetical protein
VDGNPRLCLKTFGAAHVTVTPHIDYGFLVCVYTQASKAQRVQSRMRVVVYKHRLFLLM